jgi:hypothetical protein
LEKIVLQFFFSEKELPVTALLHYLLKCLKETAKTGYWIRQMLAGVHEYVCCLEVPEESEEADSTPYEETRVLSRNQSVYRARLLYSSIGFASPWSGSLAGAKA